MIKASGNLVEENFALRQELLALKIEQQLTWSMLVDVVRKLQASSASIKAAVSSLLSYDIFWDVTNQHEFLLTIDASANQTSDLVMLLSLAFRLEAERLEIKREPHSLQEILTNVEANIQRRFPEKQIILSMKQEGQVAWVDYDYLSLTLIIFFEALLSNPAQHQLAISANEEKDVWKLEIVGVDPATCQLLQTFRSSLDNQVSFRKEENFSSENLLKLLVVIKLLDFQGLTMQLPGSPGFTQPLAIVIPTRNN
jgi:K+-sensing histidine kinase KdpD